MHVLIIPSEQYIPEEDPLQGIFQQHQAYALKRAGFRVGIISPLLRSLLRLRERVFGWTNGVVVENDKGIPVYRYFGWIFIPLIVRFYARQWISAGMILFDKYVADQGMPDVVHAHNALLAGCLAARIKRKFGVPYVLTEHSSFYARGLIRPADIPCVKRAYSKADCCVVVSPALGVTLEKYLGNYVRVWVPNILDGKFEYQQGSCTKENSDGMFRFLNVGSLIDIKGQDDLLRAFAVRMKGRANMQLHIIGDGPLRDRLEALSVGLEVSAQVFFHGQLRHDDVLKEMKRCSAYVHTSRYETFCVALIEALACGKPVLSTACGGPECIVNDINGILVRVGDIDAIGDGMGRLAQEIESYDCVRIRKDCLDRFGERAVVGKISEIYESVVRGEFADRPGGTALMKTKDPGVKI